MRALDLSAVPAPMPGVIDLMDYYPGPIAKTHKLRARDGRFYEYDGDLRGCWSRTLEPGYVDYHLWTPTTMYYLGWRTPERLHWAVPPMLALPRYWNPYEPYRRDSVEFYVDRVHRVMPSDVRLRAMQTTVTAEMVMEQGERLFRLWGVLMVGDHDKAEAETWWLSPALPVEGGGTAPGMRGFELKTGDVVTGVAEFLEWVPR